MIYKVKTALRRAFIALSMGILTSASAAATTYNYTAIDDPLATPRDTFAVDINDHGQVAGWYYDTSGGTGGFVESHGVYTNIADPLTGPGNASLAGINDSGVVAGTYSRGGRYFGFEESGGTYTTLVDPLAGRLGTVVTGISNSGEVVGYFWDVSSHTHSFTESGGVYTTLPDDPSGFPTSTIVSDVNSAGEVVGHFGDISGGAGIHGFFESLGAFTTVDVPAGRTYLTGINDHGDIVGFSNSAPAKCFLDVGGVFTYLSYPGSLDTFACRINNKGAIVGTYDDRSGRLGFVATPTSNVPEPSGWLLTLVGSALLGGASRARVDSRRAQ